MFAVNAQDVCVPGYALRARNATENELWSALTRFRFAPRCEKNCREDMSRVCRVLLAISLLWNVSALGQQSKPILPDPKLTPGDVFEVTIHDICIPGYSKKVRAVPRSLRNEAYRLYGITSPNPGDYQLDHLIPLCLGGSNSIRNLWPQSYRTSPWNAHVKDVLERRLCNLVCAGKVDLQTAQHEIANDWIKAYQKYIAKTPPTAEVQGSHGLYPKLLRRVRYG